MEMSSRSRKRARSAADELSPQERQKDEVIKYIRGQYEALSYAHANEIMYQLFFIDRRGFDVDEGFNRMAEGFDRFNPYIPPERLGEAMRKAKKSGHGARYGGAWPAIPIGWRHPNRGEEYYDV